MRECRTPGSVEGAPSNGRPYSDRLHPPSEPAYSAHRFMRRFLIDTPITLIAATALERDLTVVTTDSDFERVPALKIMIIPRRSLEAR